MTFFFKMSPIPADEFERYGEIVDRLTRSGRERLPREIEDALLGLALRFTPALHKMASLSPIWNVSFCKPETVLWKE